METPPYRRASTSVALSASFMLMAAGAAACGSSKSEYAAVCIDPNTNKRIADSYCDDDRYSDGSYLGFVPIPYYYSSRFTGRMAGIGQPVAGGIRSLPTAGGGLVVRKNAVSAKGGSAAKAVRGGGFGGAKASG